MRRFELRVRFPTGTILVGGHSALPAGISSAHAVDGRGRPVIPATALRGALRESLEAILRGVGRGACDSGTGIDPAQSPQHAHARECTVDDGACCIPCRIFGTRRARLQEGASSFSSLILGDAVLVDEEDVDWMTRQHVAISRSRRSAEDQRLFVRRVPSLMDRCLVARGFSVEPELDRYLEAGVRGTKHLGSGRSVGLARVELELEWLDDIEPPTAENLPEARSTFGVRVRLESPTALGTSQASDNFRNVRGEIPGSVLRGAIGFAVARSRPKGDSDDEQFEALVDEHEGAHFGFLYPVDVPSQTADRTTPLPWPVTARACKSESHAHGVVDTLLDRIAVAAVGTSAQAARVHAGALRACRAKSSDSSRASREHCAAPLRSVRGNRRHGGDLAKRVITRVSIERRSSSARDGALYSYELLEPGTVFEGTIRNVPQGSQGLLASALRLPIHVGRGASSGWGRVSVEVFDPVEPPPLEARGADFQAALLARLRDAGLSLDGADRLLPITFLSPYLPEEGDHDGRRTLERLMGPVEEWVVVARRFEREGGWDQRTGRPFAELAVAAGAVYVARLAIPWRDAQPVLGELERSGAGRRRHQGYGHLVFFDPFILNRGNSP